ncbi:amidohydrolase [Isoptericola cucumis]|uniref:amidohydrolase n=1 Tax=Isoptericola cucumis TaxID=1776856 RepID=UPI003209F072
MSALTTSELTAIYTDLHAHPELGFAEHRTAGVVAERLRGWGYAVHEGIGGTGVVGVLTNGDGPRVLLRADMDGLPVTERTGLPYASTQVTTTDDGQEAGVMHACGHDVHVTCLLGAAAALADGDIGWSGTLVVLFQPAEELGRGARAMLDDGLFATVGGAPDVVLGQHVLALPAGVVAVRAGVAMSAADSLRITLYGRGGHGSMPETTVDPVLMAAATVQRLQGIVAREVAAGESAVVTVGSVRAGSEPNIIPDRAELLVNVRTYTLEVRERVLAAIRRIVEAEAAASWAPQPPEIETVTSFAATVNDPEATERTRSALGAALDARRAAVEAVGGSPAVVTPAPHAASEDVGELATAAGAPLVYWFLGGHDPAQFADVDLAGAAAAGQQPRGIPSNHSPYFAPAPEPTLDLGVATLVAAAREWLD